MNITEQQNREREIAGEGLKKKGFFKDLGWGLLGFTILFSGVGLMMIFIPSNINPYWSILPFSCALLLDIVCIVSYIQYYPGKRYETEDNYKT